MTQELSSPASVLVNLNALPSKSQYINVTWHKQSQKWRAFVAVPGERTKVDGRWKTKQKWVYVGLYDNPHVAAAAREAKIASTPSLSRATHNVIAPKWLLAYENLVRDPDASQLAPYKAKHPHEHWSTIPGYEFQYEVSTYGRIRELRPWGFALVVPVGDRVVLSRGGLLRGFRVDTLVKQAFVSP